MVPILLVIALLLILLAALKVPNARIDFGWLGLFCFVLAQLLGVTGFGK